MDGAEAILHMCKSQLDGLICAVTGEVPQPPPPLIKNHCYGMEWSKYEYEYDSCEDTVHI